MRLQIYFKCLTALVILLLVGMISMQVYKRRSGWPKPASPALESVSDRGRTASSDYRGRSGTYVSRTAPGIISAAPRLEEVRSLTEVPWKSSEVRRAYDESAAHACLLLPAEQPVYTPLASLGNNAAVEGCRVPALTIRLAMDKKHELKLPHASKAAILTYLRDHEIAIEPVLHLDDNGHLYFGGEVRAAFYNAVEPDVTTTPEPMVEESMARIRVLGALRGAGVKSARTLVLAIRYASDDESETEQAAGVKFETELIFLHLPIDATPASPRLAVFASSDGRETLHRLQRMPLSMDYETALLTATLRFNSFVMMGLYPTSPIITGAQPHRSVSLPVQSLLRLPVEANDESQHVFQSVLDHFSQHDDLSQLAALQTEVSMVP